MRTAKNWKDLARLVVVCAVAWVSLVSYANAQSSGRRSTCGKLADVNLKQNWSDQEKVKFWFNSQGSRIMPYSWFIALEQATNEDLFIDPCYMESLGFIVVPGHGLPIGFAQDTNRTRTATYIGLTCAACHTARLTIGTRTAIVEGGPSLVDFSAFLNALVDSTRASHDNEDKFTRWANRVNDTSIPRPELRRRLKALSQELAARSKQNTPTSPYGFGRVDAFGHIFNRVLATAIDVDGNARTPDAPVSYPFLWDTPKDMHQNVQWNWSAKNGQLVIGVPGDLLRNLGELLGVFGTFDLTEPSACGVPCYKTSSFNRSKLEGLEKLVETLWSPVWPRELDGMSINQALADTGKVIYQGKGKCEACHRLIKRDDPDRKAGDRLVPLNAVKTDSAMTDAYNDRLFGQTLQSGLLKGRTIGLKSPFKEFGETTNGDSILHHVAAGVFLGGGRNDARSLKEEARAQEAAPDKGYKARSLNGIWATAPYLHNGSVPNLRTLLSNDRGMGFWVGNNTFDPKNVGLSIEKGPNASWFDPTKPGNSNQGHPFGLDLTDDELRDDDEKDALIEFLKTL